MQILIYNLAVFMVCFYWLDTLQELLSLIHNLSFTNFSLKHFEALQKHYCDAVCCLIKCKDNNKLTKANYAINEKRKS